MRQVRDLMRMSALPGFLVPEEVADGASAHCWLVVLELNHRPAAGAVLTAA